jgi:hypothetical protein
MRRLLLPLLVVAAAASPAPAGATVTFGADLSLTPDLSFNCPLAPPFFGPYRLPDTCTAFTSGVFGGGAVRASHLVPDGEGVITKLRLREPPNAASSPLRLTVLRALRSPLSTVAACCTVTSQSAPFAAPPGVSEVTFTPPIPVHSITTVTGVYEFEAVALTATDANSVIPAASAPGHGSGAYYPAAQPGQERFEQQTSLGTDTQILFEVDWEPVDTSNGTGGSAGAGTPGGGTPGAGTPAAPAAPLTVRRGTFTRRTATVPLVCRLDVACTGVLRLQRRSATGRATAAAARQTSYGRGPFRIAAGKRGTATVTLNAAGRTLVRQRRSVTLYANATAGGRLVSAQVTLRRR